MASIGPNGRRNARTTLCFVVSLTSTTHAHRGVLGSSLYNLTMPTLYRYIGPPEIAARVNAERLGVPIRSPDDVRAWIKGTAQDIASGSVIATFIVDESGLLRIADRRSEHVACAGGRPVWAAGEITFAVTRNLEVTEVSNQSTGYCPEPSSFEAVAAALDAAGILRPSNYTFACEFRRCERCDTFCLIKDDSFACAVCGGELPVQYNVQ